MRDSLPQYKKIDMKKLLLLLLSVVFFTISIHSCNKTLADKQEKLIIGEWDWDLGGGAFSSDSELDGEMDFTFTKDGGGIYHKDAIIDPWEGDTPASDREIRWWFNNDNEITIETWDEDDEEWDEWWTEKEVVWIEEDHMTVGGTHCWKL